MGLGSVGASVMAACGGGGGSAGSGGNATTESTTAGSERKVGKGQAIARESEVTPNGAFPFTDADTGQQSVLVRLQSGEIVAYSAVCTHQACVVAYKDGKLACPCHGSVFDPAEGAAVLNGPANRPLPRIKTEIRGGEVFLV